MHSSPVVPAPETRLGAMSRRPSTRAALLAGCALLPLLTACNAPPAVNPWREDSIPESTWSTPSADGILAANATPVLRGRGTPPIQAPRVSNDTPHYPLYWSDPFEDQGDLNKQFAWTWQDYLGMPYGLGRFILNTVAFPVSAVVDPPGTSMVSDGTVEHGRVHDKMRGKSPNPTATDADFHPEALAEAEVVRAPPAPETP